MEVEAGSPAAAALDAQSDKIEAALEALNAPDDGTIWCYEPDGHEAINCVTSLLDTVREDDPQVAIFEFYRRCFTAARDEGLVDGFVRATRASG